MGIFGFRSKKKDDPPRDDAFEASVAGAEMDAPPGTVETTEKRVVTEEERARFEAMLLEHDLDGALLRALAFAKPRTGSLLQAKHYVRRARARLWENCSWDPKKGPALPIFLCGLVRSEIHIDRDKDERREATEQGSLADPSTSSDAILDPEALVLAREEQDEDARSAASDAEWLRAEFESKKDAVNLCWMELRSKTWKTSRRRWPRARRSPRMISTTRRSDACEP